MRAFFFLKIWKDYIQRCGTIHSSKWYNMQRSIISIQSFEIFISMAESLVMLIMVHREYYPNYPLFLWEHGTEALEHIFGISRQVLADFNFYEFYKICILFIDLLSVLLYLSENFIVCYYYE